MRTTLEIDEDLVLAAMEASGARTKTEAVRAGLQSLVDAAARRRLAALRGRIPALVEAIREGRESEAVDRSEVIQILERAG